MEPMVSNLPLNAAQIYLLQTFAHIKSEDTLNELNSVLLDFYRTKLDEELDKWCEENDMTTEKFNKMCTDIHYRTPYVTK